MDKSFQTEKEYNEFLEDNFLKHIGHEHTELLCKSLDLKEDEWKEFEVPESLDQWFEDFQRLEQKRSRENERRVKLINLAKKAAIFIVFIIGINYVLVSNVEAYRIKWLNTITNIQDKFTQIDFVEKDNDNVLTVPEDWEGKYYATYIPSGFHLEDSLTGQGISRLTYKDNQGNEIILHQFNLQSSIQVDSEAGISSQIMIGDYRALLIEKDNSNSISWSVEDAALHINASGIEVEELIKIAESVVIKK